MYTVITDLFPKIELVADLVSGPQIVEAVSGSPGLLSCPTPQCRSELPFLPEETSHCLQEL